jgi:hypothetical protein
MRYIEFNKVELSNDMFLSFPAKIIISVLFFMPPEIISIIVRWTLVATIVAKAPAIKRVRINRGVLLFRWKAN